MHKLANLPSITKSILLIKPIFFSSQLAKNNANNKKDLENKAKDQHFGRMLLEKQKIIANKIMENNYKLINSSPNDSVVELQQNFIRIKTKLNNRNFYMPHKKQFLMELDRAYEQILQVHEVENIMEIGKPQGPLTRSQRITYQLNKIRKAKIYELFQTYQMAAIFLIFLVIAQIILEQYANWGTPQLSLVQSFTVTAKIKQLFGQFKNWLYEQYEKMRPKTKLSTILVKYLEKNRENIKDETILQLIKVYKERNKQKEQLRTKQKYQAKLSAE